MRSIDLKEIDELLVLSQEYFQHVFHIVLICNSQLLLSGLSGWLLARQVCDQFKDLVAILSDDILRELLHRIRAQSLCEPSADVLAVLREDVHLDGVVANQRSGSPRDD